MPQTDDQCNLHLMLMILPSHEQHHVFENVMLVFYILLHFHKSKSPVLTM